MRRAAIAAFLVAALAAASPGMALAASSFTPKNVSGCVFWMDASNAASITSASGSVSQINDLCGSNNAVQATTADRPVTGVDSINGLNVLAFNSSFPQYLTAATSTMPSGTGPAFTTYQVVNPNVTGNATSISWGASSGSGTRMSFLQQSASGYQFSIFGSSLSDATLLNSAAHILSHVYSGGDIGANYSQFFDGTQSTLTASGTPATPVIGASPPLFIGTSTSVASSFSGDIAEILVFSGAQAASVRQEIEGYLACKWGLQANLASTHPYKTLCPKANVGNGTFPPSNAGNGQGINGNRGNG